MKNHFPLLENHWIFLLNFLLIHISFVITSSAFNFTLSGLLLGRKKRRKRKRTFILKICSQLTRALQIVHWDHSLEILRMKTQKEVWAVIMHVTFRLQQIMICIFQPLIKPLVFAVVKSCCHCWQSSTKEMSGWFFFFNRRAVCHSFIPEEYFFEHSCFWIC